jgi:hypothetical protein
MIVSCDGSNGNTERYRLIVSLTLRGKRRKVLSSMFITSKQKQGGTLVMELYHTTVVMSSTPILKDYPKRPMSHIPRKKTKRSTSRAKSNAPLRGRSAITSARHKSGARQKAVNRRPPFQRAREVSPVRDARLP